MQKQTVVYDTKTTGLMDDARRADMLADGWKIARIDGGMITWRKCVEVVLGPAETERQQDPTVTRSFWQNLDEIRGPAPEVDD